MPSTVNRAPTPADVQKTVERSFSVSSLRWTSAAPSARSEKIGTSPAKTSTIAATP